MLLDTASGGSPRKTVREMNRYHLWKFVLPAVFAGTFVAVWLQQTAISLLRAGIAQTTLATSPVFGLVVARIRREHVSLRAVIGALMALAGIAILLLWPDRPIDPAMP